MESPSHSRRGQLTTPFVINMLGTARKYYGECDNYHREIRFLDDQPSSLVGLIIERLTTANSGTTNTREGRGEANE